MLLLAECIDSYSIIAALIKGLLTVFLQPTVIILLILVLAVKKLKKI